jgi:hypothetical protein
MYYHVRSKQHTTPSRCRTSIPNASHDEDDGEHEFRYFICYCSKYISSIKKKEKREKQRKIIVQKIFIGFRRRKLNKGKLDQINSESSQI